MARLELSSEFLQRLAALPNGEVIPGTTAHDGTARAGEMARMPSLQELSKQLGASVASLREQLEVAEALGLVEVRPRLGIRRLPYTFLPAVRQSLSYALELDREYFSAFSDLRNHIEASFWPQAVATLTPEDHAALHRLLAAARQKLNGNPVQIPHNEHRQLHLTIYSRLGNPFVQGILEAYWDAYEAVGLNVFAGYEYLQQVWDYHERMVDAICRGDSQAGYQALVEHTYLLHQRPSP